MNYTSALTIGAALVISSSQTFAGGEIYGRTADTASIRSCDGNLVEQIHEGGNIHGFFGLLLLACMQSKIEASWVLLSGTSCNDPADNPTKCNSRKVRAVPRFIVDENFWQAKQTPSTAYPMLYNLLKYGIGENCRVNEQKYEIQSSYNHSDTDKYWQCTNISIQDGIENFSKGKWRTFRLTTNSTVPIDVIGIEDKPLIYNPRTHFVLPESNYTLNIEEYL